MFDDINEAKEIIINCYRKFKSYVYYANNLHYLRLKIANFEVDHDKMELCFSTLAKIIVNEDYYEWDKLLLEVSYKVFPKVTGAKIQDTNLQILSNYIDKTNEINIEKVNFFIDAPIEIFILDTLWTLLVGKLFLEKHVFGDEIQANIFNELNFNNKEKHIVKAIDFKNLSIYKPYFTGYKNWKNEAIYKIEQLYDNGRDSTLLSLDLSSYFYTVDFDFNMLNDLLISEEDNRYTEFNHITNLIIKLYKTYSNIIYKERTDITEHQTIIPIGIISSGMIANVYLHDFDKKMEKNKKVVYYSRYVDDMIIVIPAANKDDGLNETINQFFQDSFLTTETALLIKGFPKISIQNDKIKILKMFAGQSKTYISILKKEISNTSEPHLLPNIDLDLNNFIESVHTHPSDTIKIRELDALDVDKLELMKFIGSYLRSKKNTAENNNLNLKKKRSNLSYYEKIDQETQEQLTLFFKGGNLFQLYAKWERIFYFAILYNNDFSLAESIYNDILRNINNINSSYAFIRKRKQKTINRRLQTTLRETLTISLSTALAIRNDIARFRDSFKTKNNLLRYAKQIQAANLFDNNLVEFPLANFYLPSDTKLRITYSGISYSQFCSRYSDASINDFAIKYSPRFIHFQEYSLSQNIIKMNEINNGEFIPKIINEYKAIVSNFASMENPLCIDVDYSNQTRKGNYVISSIKAKSPSKFNFTDFENVYVALANMNLEKHKLITGGKFNFNQCTFERKSELYKLLNEAYINTHFTYSLIFGKNGAIRFKHEKKKIKSPVKFLAFPEVSIPIEWLDDVAKFVRITGTAVVCGVKHFLRGKRIYNCVATIIPVGNHLGKYHNAFVTLREKNDYSPDEISLIDFNNCEYNKNPISYNNIFNWDGIRFSVFDCYELTDIYARAIMKSKLDILFAPEYNKDISYFSNIVESASRDIFCFVTQVNTSNFGDTKIIAPYKSEVKCIVDIKGGERDSIHIGKLNLKEYWDYQNFEGTKEYKNWISAEKKDQKYQRKKTYYKFKKYKKTSARYKRLDTDIDVR